MCAVQISTDWWSPIHLTILPDPLTGQATSPKEELTKLLAHRPDREELVERNILPSECAFPTSQCAFQNPECWILELLSILGDSG
jgi:hypothetical protein